MNALRIQGLIFSLLATLIAGTTMAIKQFDEKTELMVLAALIVVLGVPHGALDTIFAHQLYGVRTTKGWAGFVFAYFVPVALVVGLWQVAPMIFLVGFLLISIAHFSGDPGTGTPLASRILYGGAIIVLPVLLHAKELNRLFSLLVGTDAAAQVVPWLRVLAWPWLIGVAVAAVWSMTADWLTGLEIAAVGLLSIFAPPLLAFTVFFCGMHSARHILRTFNYSKRLGPGRLIAASVGPMLAVVALSGAAFLWLRGLPVEIRLMQLVFVGLAALTAPHMALIERVRFAGWAVN
jgi:Brp/Blh family beta-carotene 15,15'-monooxygenase